MTTPADRDRWSYMPPSSTITVVEWRDPFVETHALAVHALSSEAEAFWLPVVGPTALLCGRRLAGWIEAAEGPVIVGLDALAGMLGVGAVTSANSPLIRTLNRMAGFNLARWRGTELAVRLVWPPLTPRQVERLPEGIAAEYQARGRVSA